MTENQRRYREQMEELERENPKYFQQHGSYAKREYKEDNNIRWPFFLGIIVIVLFVFWKAVSSGGIGALPTTNAGSVGINSDMSKMTTEQLEVKKNSAINPQKDLVYELGQILNISNKANYDISVENLSNYLVEISDLETKYATNAKSLAAERISNLIKYHSQQDPVKQNEMVEILNATKDDIHNEVLRICKKYLVNVKVTPTTEGYNYSFLSIEANQ